MIVVNNSWRLARWADCLFAMDHKWWQYYGAGVRNAFRGELCTVTHHAHRHGATRVMQGTRPMETHGNSGAGAVALAVLRGASKVLLLGYDCAADAQRRHWHDDHPQCLGNAGSMPRWAAQFASLAAACDVPVINATRGGALDVFPRVRLEEALA